MGYSGDMTESHSELRIPADRAFIVVAKRSAAAFAAVAGLPIEAIEDVVIAVAQACDHAITRLHHSVGVGGGQLRLDFRLQGQRIDVQVRSVCSRAEVETARLRREALIEHKVLSQRRRALLAEQREGRDEAREHEEARAAGELAIQVMGLFVDDFGYRADDRTGAMRVRLTKYRVS